MEKFRSSSTSAQVRFGNASLKCWPDASHDAKHRSFVTPERVLSEYKKDLIFYL